MLRGYCVGKFEKVISGSIVFCEVVTVIPADDSLYKFLILII